MFIFTLIYTTIGVSLFSKHLLMEYKFSPSFSFLKYLYLVIIFILASNFLQAQNYADGSGRGSLQRSVFWLTWTNGLYSRPTGSDSSLVTAGVYVWQFTPGVKVIATVSNINAITKNGALRPTTSGSSAYNPDGLGVLYPGISGAGLRDSLFAANIKFDITVDLQMLVNGTWKSISYPGLVVGDAETLANDNNTAGLNEYIKASAADANTSWQLLDFRKEQSSKFPEDYKIKVSNSGKDVKLYIDNSVNTADLGDGYLQAVLFAKNAHSLSNIQTQGRGYTAVALGLVAPFDFGDAPSTFGNAGNYIGNVTYNTLPSLVDSVYTAVKMSQITVGSYSNLYLGSYGTDADGNPPHSSGATTDNNTENNDEDGFDLSTQPGIYVNNANNLFITVKASNKQSTSATVYGWIDFDGDGQFSSSEVATATVPSGASSLPVKLTFDYGKFGKTIKQGATYARFRITTTKLLDNPNTSVIDERSTSIALDGETEDYQLNDINYGNISKPEGVNDVDSTPVNTPVTTTVKVNDIVNSYYATVDIANPPSSGKVVVNADGTVTYTPDSTFTGTDTYTYTLTTPAGLVSDPINVVVYVKPKGVNDSVITPINTPIIINVRANDGIAEVKNAVSIVTSPSNGTATATSDSTFNYIPSKDFVGLDTFTYILTTPDGISSDPIRVIIKVVPLGVDDLDSTFINKPVTTKVLANDGIGALTDTLKLATDPANGTIKLNKDGTVTYTPANGFTGKDTYTYTLTDSVGAITHPITVTILVKPIGVLDRDTTAFNSPLTIDVKANDSAKGLNDAVVITSNPRNGTIVVNADSTVTYTPNTDFVGKDTCYYTLITADSVQSKLIPIYITVLPRVKKTDVLIVKTLNTPGKLIAGETISFTITATNNGADTATNVIVKDTLAANIGTATIVTTQNGTASYNSTKKILTWNIGTLINGQSTSLTFKTIIDSGNKVINTAYVSAKEIDPDTTNNHSTVGPITIQRVPQGVADLDSTFINNPVTTTVKTNDGSINMKDTVKVSSTPVYGTVVINKDGTATYTPNSGYTGKDTYTYTLTSDSGIVSQPITVTIKVKPIGVLDRETTNENSAITIAVKNNDSAKGGNNTVNIITNTNNGSVVVNTDGTITYTPNKNFVGNDTCYYTLITADSLSSSPIAVFITVVPPIKKADISIKKTLLTKGSLTVGQGINFSLNVTNNGPDDATGIIVTDTLDSNISNVSITQPQNGVASYDKLARVLVWKMGNLSVNQTSSITFTTIIDSGKSIENNAFVIANEIDPDTTNNHSSIGKISVLPMPVNGVADLDSTLINLPVITNVKANDSAKNALDTVKIATNPTSGVVTVNTDGTVIYTPNNGYVGKDVYTYTLTNTDGTVSLPIKVTVLVKPVGVNDADTTEENKSITMGIKANDGASGKSCSVQIIAQPVHGKLVVNSNNTVTYTPDSGYVGKDSYKYILITTDSVTSAPITATILVTPPVTRSVDLSVVKQLITTGSITIGESVEFSITVTNNGPDDATNVVVTDVLANNLESPTALTSGGLGTIIYNSTTKKITWNVGGLAASQVATLTFNAVIDSGSYLNNTAIVKGAEPDPDTTNNKSYITSTPIYPAELFIPNVITPNGDGKNDNFVIQGLQRFPNSGLSIFNRWDNMVYTTPDYQNDWNGKGLSSGTYYYVLKLRLLNGNIEVKKGWVMVIK